MFFTKNIWIILTIVAFAALIIYAMSRHSQPQQAAASDPPAAVSVKSDATDSKVKTLPVTINRMPIKTDGSYIGTVNGPDGTIVVTSTDRQTVLSVLAKEK